uniref:PHD and RING finger domain-containing protein 1 n=1 Tax=Hydra vulgaris TaxID=6087 RepID=T2M3K5_HYDVU
MYNESEEESNEEDLFATKSSRKRKLLVYSDEEDSSGGSDTDDNNSDDLEESDGLCPICLSEFTNQMVGVPKTCNHVFCLECLQEWAKKINNCPVDRTKFNFVLVYKIKDGPLVEEIYIEDKESKDDEFEDPPTYCEVCGSCEREDSLLLCDECDNGYHLDCLVPPLLAVPYDEWFCSNCQPKDQTVEVSLSKPSGFIGDEELLMKIYEDHCASDFINETSDSRVRTVAKVKNERRQNRRLERSRSTRPRRPRNKESMQRKRRKKMRRAVKRMNKELSYKITEKANNEKLKQKSEDNDTVISIYGDPYDLNEFHDVFDDEHEPTVKHDVTNTEDVVGSILDGFITLDPNKVVVERDGSIKEKKKMEKALITNVPYVMPARKKKIRFIDDNDDVDIEKNENDKSVDKCLSSPKKTTSENNSSQDVETSCCSIQTKREILSGQLLKFKNDIALDKKIKKQLAEMRQKSNKKEFKSMASLHSISGFKIPKKVQIEFNSLTHQPDVCQLDNSSAHHSGDSQKINSQTVNITQPMQNRSHTKVSGAYAPNEFRKPIEKKQVLTLEKKIELYNQGKYKEIRTKSREEIIKDTKERCLTLMKGKKNNQDLKTNALNLNQSNNSKILIQRSKTSSNNKCLDIKDSQECLQNQLEKGFNKIHKNKISNDNFPNKEPVKVSFAEYKMKMQQDKEKKSLFIKDVNECCNGDSKKNLFEELFGDPSISYLEETKEPCASLSQTQKINLSDTSKPHLSDTPKAHLSDAPSLNLSGSSKKNLFETLKSNLSGSSNVSCCSVIPKIDHKDKKFFFPIQTDALQTFSNLNNVVELGDSALKSNLHGTFHMEHFTNHLSNIKYDLKSEGHGKLVNNCGIPIAIVYPRSNLEENFPIGNNSSVVNLEKKQAAEFVNQKSPPIDKFYLEKIKALLKYDYKNGALTKDQWKDIVKQSVKQIQRNIDYYKQDGMIENLVESYLKKIKKKALFENMLPAFI